MLVSKVEEVADPWNGGSSELEEGFIRATML
jgi:hypothetical protein